jgi:hypothetical protein
LIVFDLAVYRGWIQGSPIDCGRLQISELIDLPRIIEKDKSHDGQRGDNDHEDSLVFSEYLNHKKVTKMLICETETIMWFTR